MPNNQQQPKNDAEAAQKFIQELTKALPKQTAAKAAQKFIQKLVRDYGDGNYIFRGITKKHGTSDKDLEQRVSSKFYQWLLEKSIIPPDTQYVTSHVTPHLEKTVIDRARARFYQTHTKVADILTDIRHYGGRVNVIDFTRDLNAALFFACNGDFNEDAEFFAIKSEKLKELDDELYKKLAAGKSGKNRSFIIKAGRTELNRHRVDIQHSVFLYPTHGYIAVKGKKLTSSDNEIGDVVPIGKHLKKEILKYLKNLYDVHEETIYDDLIGFIANEENYENAQIELYRANLLRVAGRYQEAIEAYIKVMKLNPQNANAYSTSGLAKTASGDYSEAIDLTPQNANTYFANGLVKTMSGNYAGAIADYTKAIELTPQNADAYYQRGLAKDEQGNYEGAIADYTKAIELTPQYAAAYHSRGLAKGKSSKPEEAIADFTKAIEINPQYTDAYDGRGLAKAQQGNYERAIADYTKAIELNPQYSDVYFNRGMSKATSGNFEKAIADFTKAIKLNPDRSEFYSVRGLAKEQLGQNKRATADYTKAIKLTPQTASAFYTRGVILIKLGKYQEAEADLIQAFESQPELKDGLRKLPKLELLLEEMPKLKPFFE